MRKCYMRLSDSSSFEYKASFECYVPRMSLLLRKSISGSDHTFNVTMDAIVVLQEFDMGKPYQIPLHRLRFVEEWYEKT